MEKCSGKKIGTNYKLNCIAGNIIRTLFQKKNGKLNCYLFYALHFHSNRMAVAVLKEVLWKCLLFQFERDSSHIFFFIFFKAFRYDVLLFNPEIKLDSRYMFNIFVEKREKNREKLCSTAMKKKRVKELENGKSKASICCM